MEAVTSSGKQNEPLFQSTLPVFRITQGKRFWRYTCMRRGCSMSFYVPEPMTGLTTPCPFCFKVSRSPMPRVVIEP